MFVGLNEKEKKLFDLLIDDVGIRDALNILTEYALLKGEKITVTQGDLVKINVDDDDGDDGEEGEISGKIPEEKKIKAEPTIIKAPAYDKESVIENSFSIYV